MPKRIYSFILCFIYLPFVLSADISPKVTLGVDCLFEGDCATILKNKRIGLITNHTAINTHFQSTVNVLKAQAAGKGYTLAALFAPEHGINGAALANENINETKDGDGLPIYSLYGKTRRPTDAMLKGIDVLIFDIQDIGTRSYTYISTMFYAMEEAAKRNIDFVVLDRPNPINGLTVDGPLLEEKWRSFIGYINVPYCHGMTIGELARYFNAEYQIGCKLEVIPMKGWRRSMTFKDTGLAWVPTSPYIPESDTPLFYPTTGILGELQLVNIGIGYTLPFKLVGAPWINALEFAKQLNKQKFPGVHFEPFFFTPMYGICAKENCQGVLIVVTDPATFKPVSTQYLLLGMIKNLYPDKFQDAVNTMIKRKKTLCNLNGTEKIFDIIVEEKHIIWKLCTINEKERLSFLKKRKIYLMKEYEE